MLSIPLRLRIKPRRACLTWEGTYSTRKDWDEPMPAPRRAKPHRGW